MIKGYCKICGKEIMFYKSRIKKYCSNNCRRSDPDWKEKISKINKKKFIGLNHQVYNLTRSLFKKEELKCVICGTTKNIQIHHKDKNRLNNKRKNLIPLCIIHHSKLHYEDNRITCTICGRFIGKNHKCPSVKDLKERSKMAKE